MLGAMIGDVIGSTYEWHPIKQTAFALFPQGSRFTDDSVLTAAVADALLHKTDGASMVAKAPMLCGINSITPAIRMPDSVKCSAPGLWIPGCRHAAATATAVPL